MLVIERSFKLSEPRGGIGCPLSTVRRWLRSVRGGHTEWLHDQGVAWIHRVDREVFATITPHIPGSVMR